MADTTLNKKIAKWCGWEYFPNDSQDRKWLIPKPYNVWTWNCPNFTESMEAILKWVVPKLSSLKIPFVVGNTKDTKPNKFLVNLYDDDHSTNYSEMDNSMPMAFCKALGKYIDAQEGK